MTFYLIPQVKQCTLREGFLKNKALRPLTDSPDSRLTAALQKLPQCSEGTPVFLEISGTTGEGYALSIREDSVTIRADSAAGAFYAIQTLRQLYREERVPCLDIVDCPDFPHRGFYHDISRGRVPTVQSIKALVDRMAFFKLNSLQLYVEHVFEFSETRELWEKSGGLTAQELREIGAYCRENYIDFVPSLSTFGHMYDILEQPEYRHLRVLSDHQAGPNLWHERMAHHTIDPHQPESLELVKSLIDQYAPHFDSPWFNICCDETFDLKRFENEGELYVEFVQRIMDHVRSLDRGVMMWADILLEHPEVIDRLPEDALFLNWYYHPDPEQIREKVARFAASHRRQIVCPGTWSWYRLCENVADAEVNICEMIRAGYENGAEGVLNTNWGDWGNPCSLELGMYGMVLGAGKSWNVAVEPGDAFSQAVDRHLYGYPGGVEMLKAVSKLHDSVSWRAFSRAYWEGIPYDLDMDAVRAVQQGYCRIQKELEPSAWGQEEFRRELLLAAEGICVMAECTAEKAGYALTRLTDTEAFLGRYRERWLAGSKESELRHIEALFRGK